jgi:hypothetical protein
VFGLFNPLTKLLSCLEGSSRHASVVVLLTQVTKPTQHIGYAPHGFLALVISCSSIVIHQVLHNYQYIQLVLSSQLFLNSKSLATHLGTTQCCNSRVPEKRTLPKIQVKTKKYKLFGGRNKGHLVPLKLKLVSTFELKSPSLLE